MEYHQLNYMQFTHEILILFELFVLKCWVEITFFQKNVEKNWNMGTLNLLFVIYYLNVIIKKSQQANTLRCCWLF